MGTLPAHRLLIIVSSASLLATVPHTIEDFAYGVPAAYHVPAQAAALLVAAALAVQASGTALAAGGDRRGLWLCLLTGLFWFAGAVYDHGLALLAGNFRQGAWSVSLVLGILLLEGTVAVLAATALLQKPVPG